MVDRIALDVPGLSLRPLWILAVLFLPYYLAIGLPYFLQADGHFDPSGALIGRDFVNYWSGAVAALSGKAAVIFDPVQFHALQEALLGRPFPTHLWSYPPHFLLIVAPLAALPYLWAYIVWLLAGLGGFLAAVMGRAWASPWALGLALAPASFANVMAGQNGFLSAALFIGAMKLVDRRPGLAALLLAGLTYKPQVGLLIPVALVAAGHWRAIAATVIAIVGCITVSTAFFGTDVWLDYLQQTLPMHGAMMTGARDGFFFMMPTAYVAGRLMELPASQGFLLQAPFSLIAVLAVAWAFRWTKRSDLRLAVLCAATLLFSPYLFNYDMTLIAFGVLVAFREALARGFLVGEPILLLLVWLLPLAIVPMNIHLLPVAPLLIAAFLFLLVYRLHQNNAQQDGKRSSIVFG